MSPPNCLSIAGVDPSGGAGVLADVKAMSALGAYACAVIAALTAQNTKVVTGIHTPPVDFVRRQIDTLFEDVRIASVKVGMLGTAVSGVALPRKPFRRETRVASEARPGGPCR